MLRRSQSEILNLSVKGDGIPSSILLNMFLMHFKRDAGLNKLFLKFHSMIYYLLHNKTINNKKTSIKALSQPRRIIEEQSELAISVLV